LDKNKPLTRQSRALPYSSAGKNRTGDLNGPVTKCGVVNMMVDVVRSLSDH
jgi:hypothetical protein